MRFTPVTSWHGVSERATRQGRRCGCLAVLPAGEAALSLSRLVARRPWRSASAKRDRIPVPFWSLWFSGRTWGIFQPRPCRVYPRIGRGRGHNPFSLRDIDLLRRMPPPDGIGSLAATAPVRSARCGETDAGEFRLDLIEKGERPPPSFPPNRPQRHLPWAWLRPPASAASAPSCRCRPVPCRSSSPSCTGPASLCRNRSSRRRIFRHLRRRYSCKAHHQPGQRLQRVQPIQGRPTPRQDRPKAVRPQRSDRPRPR